MFNRSKTKSLLLVAVMLVAMTGGALAAAPTVDTETTDTSQTSELQDGDTQMHNATTNTNLSWSADSANASIEIAQDGDTIFERSPEPYNNASGTYYYSVSLADDGSDYEGLEVGARESATLNVTLTNDTAADDSDTTNLEFTYEHTEESAWIASESPETEGASNGLFGGFSLSSINVFSSSDDSEDEPVGTVLSTDSTNITENTSEIQLDTLNSNLTDAFSASTDDSSEGDLIWTSYTQVSTDDSSQYVPVFYQSAGDQEWLDTEEDAYATIADDGETMTVHNPNALLADDQISGTLDVTTVGDEALGMGNSAQMLSNYGAGWTKSNIGVFGALDTNGNPSFVTDVLEEVTN